MLPIVTDTASQGSSAVGHVQVSCAPICITHGIGDQRTKENVNKMVTAFAMSNRLPFLCPGSLYSPPASMKHTNSLACK